MNGRMYDPSLGRFLSADPILQNPTSLQGHNRYSYVLNNPLKYTDPSGYKVKPAGWDAPWEYSAYVNFGPKGGSLSGSYWANGYRSEGLNFVMMSGSTFSNMYGSEKYSIYMDYITGDRVDVSSADYGTFADAVNSIQSQNPLFFYLITAFNKYTLVSSNSALSGITVGTDGGLLSQRDSEGFLPATTPFEIAEIEGLLSTGNVSIDPSILSGIAIIGGMISGLEQSYKYGENLVKYAQRIDGKLRSAAVLTRANQINATKMVTRLKVVGRGVSMLNFVTSGYQFLNSDKSGNDYARLGGAAVIGATVFIPFVGPLISIGLGVADSNGAFDSIYNYFE